MRTVAISLFLTGMLILVVINEVESRVIQQQQNQIRTMMQNPACMVEEGNAK